MIASVLRLSRTDVKNLRITDAYSLHRVVYSLFEDMRKDEDKQASAPSGILYADKGGDFNCRQILILSNRPPIQREFGEVESKEIRDSFLTHDRYSFEVTVNPTRRDSKSGKNIAVLGRDPVVKWFLERASESWGFSVKPESLQIQQMSVQSFVKKNHTVTQGSATLIGELEVTDRQQFMKSFKQGVGRGRAFGFGLLQIVPLT